MVAIFVCPYSWSLFVGATSFSERREVFRMQQSGRVHPGPVGLAHEVQLLPQLECSRQMQPPPAPLPHEQLMSGLLLVLQNSQWDPHGTEKAWYQRGRERAGTSTIKQPGTNRVYIESSSSSLRRSTERDHEVSQPREREVETTREEEDMAM